MESFNEIIMNNTVYTLFSNVPNFKNWAANPMNGISEFLDLDGVVLGGVASFLKESNFSSGLSNHHIEDEVITVLNKLALSGDDGIIDLIRTEFFESIAEDAALFERIKSKSNDTMLLLI